MDIIQAFINQIQTPVFTKVQQRPFRIVVKHKTGLELAVEEEKRGRKIKSLQRKNKRNRRKTK